MQKEMKAIVKEELERQRRSCRKSSMDSSDINMTDLNSSIINDIAPISQGEEEIIVDDMDYSSNTQDQKKKQGPSILRSKTMITSESLCENNDRQVQRDKQKSAIFHRVNTLGLPGMVSNMKKQHSFNSQRTYEVSEVPQQHLSVTFRDQISAYPIEKSGVTLVPNMEAD